jgi:hypothetical protein
MDATSGISSEWLARFLEVRSTMQKKGLGIIALTATFFLCATSTRFMLRAQNHDEKLTPKTAGELLQQAEQLIDIRSGNAPSFRLTALVEVYDEKHRKKGGKYTLLWNSPTIWKEEITFPDYSQIRLGRINKQLISRNPPTPSEPVYRIGHLMDFADFLRLGLRDQIGGLHERTKYGLAERRVDITEAGVRPWKMVYFSGSAPVPIRLEYKSSTLDVRYSPSRAGSSKEFDLRFELQDYMEFHGLQFPRTLRRFESNALKDQIQVQEWTEATFRESDFAPPDDSHWINWCPHMTPPRLETTLLMTPDLPFPPQLRTGGPPSRVVVYGIIGTDGHWHNIEAVKSEGTLVDSFWISQMHKQRFEPALCGENPAEYEMMIQFDYP